MNRKDKIKLLQDISAGNIQIDEILPVKSRIWVQDASDPFLFFYRDENLTRRIEEIPAMTIEKGCKVRNIKIIKDSTSAIIAEKINA